MFCGSLMAESGEANGVFCVGFLGG